MWHPNEVPRQCDNEIGGVNQMTTKTTASKLAATLNQEP